MRVIRKYVCTTYELFGLRSKIETFVWPLGHPVQYVTLRVTKCDSLKKSNVLANLIIDSTFASTLFFPSTVWYAEISISSVIYKFEDDSSLLL